MSHEIFPSSAKSARTKVFEKSERVKLQIKPERNLLAAVLARAISDAYGVQATDAYAIRSARAWLYAPLELDKPFSFGYVAVHLDLDPLYLRNALREHLKDPEKMENCLYCLK